jgi:hypothetical protein|tara:strand:- start:1245 stop:1448 length:204 start_codon:yes stop_codon:yes gene_type:complete
MGMDEQYEYAVWVGIIMYALGAGLYLNILDSTDEESNAPVRVSLLWPYIAIRVIIERILFGNEGDSQ